MTTPTVPSPTISVNSKKGLWPFLLVIAVIIIAMVIISKSKKTEIELQDLSGNPTGKGIVKETWLPGIKRAA